jgi:hypothetical protein
MTRDNIGWGAPRIHGELKMLGIQVSESTVTKYMIRLQKPPSQTLKTFLLLDRDSIYGAQFRNRVKASGTDHEYARFTAA